MEIESLEEILIQRKAIELELIDNEDGQDALTDIVAMFDTGQDMAELENILDTINDAWNYFPHKIIGGLSPAEMLYNSAHKK